MAWLIRLYDQNGRLLYIAGTATDRVVQRMSQLRGKMPWWPFVDQRRVLNERVPAAGLSEALAAAIVAECPKYYTTAEKKQPYLRKRPAPSDYERRVRAMSPVNRVATRRGLV